MSDYLFLMHDNVPPGDTAHDDNWGPYIGRLQASGNFQGGSAIGAGICARKSGATPDITLPLSGFIRVSASSLDDAQTLFVGNPVFESGGPWRLGSCLGPSNVSPTFASGPLRGGRRRDSHIS
jgi:hypothetical protein